MTVPGKSDNPQVTISGEPVKARFAKFQLSARATVEDHDAFCDCHSEPVSFQLTGFATNGCAARPVTLEGVDLSKSHMSFDARIGGPVTTSWDTDTGHQALHLSLEQQEQLRRGFLKSWHRHHRKLGRIARRRKNRSHH